MEELVKKIVEIEGVQYVPWKDVVSYIDTVQVGALKEGLTTVEEALMELRDSLAKINTKDI